MDFQLVAHFGNSTDPSYFPDQGIHFGGQDLTGQSDSLASHDDGDGSWMRDHPPDGRADPLVEDVALRFISLESCPERCRGASGPIPRIPGGGYQALPDLVAGVHSLIAQERTTAGPSVRVEEIHGACTYDHAGDEGSLLVHTDSSARINTERHLSLYRLPING
jgi:hypothetical protein